MNVLILSLSVGYGHDQVSYTLKRAFLSVNLNNQVKIVNTIKLISPLLDKVILDSYLNIIKFYPRAWGKIYEKTNILNPVIDINEITNKMTSSRIKKSITDFKPDVIICTHSFASSIIASLKEKRIINCPLVSIITDYNIHSSYINDYTDYYIVAHESLIHNVKLYGIETCQILPFGIPIRLEFSARLDKNEIIKKLSLKNEMTILVMGGSLGLGAIKGIVKELDSNFSNIQIITVTGFNEKLKKSLAKIRTKNDILIYGFISNINELMEVSNYIISKPGGVTCAEILSKGKPLIINSPLPGQESDNAEFLLNYGVAVKASRHNTISYLITNVLNQDLKVDYIKKTSLYLSKPNAAIDIVNFITKKFF